ncbi:MAG: hypothetical protein ACRDMA_02505 [Solirubrobacterales bacterium]
MPAATVESTPVTVRADYLRGDPAHDGPITRGTLELESDGLRFSASGGPELRIDLRDMEGLTVSGRSPYEHPRRRVRGAMFVAARRNGTVDVWEFALERDAGARLRDRIHRELHMRGLRRPPLPFVEQLVGPIEELDLPTANGNGHATGHANGHPAADSGSSLFSWRVALVAVVISAIVVAEVLVALSLLR